MKTYGFSERRLLALSIFILSLVLASPAFAEEEGSKTSMDPQMQAMMAKWQEYASPNENHKVLDALVGNWNHTVKW